MVSPRQGKRRAARAGRIANRTGAAMLEYILVCAVLVLVGAIGVPYAIDIVSASFRMILAMIGSPHPAFF